MFTMIRKIGLLTLLVLSGLVVTHGQAPVWKEFLSQDLQFKVAFPGSPRAEVNELSAAAGKRYAHWFIVELPQRFFGISVTDFPNLPIMLKEEQLRTNYDSVRDLALKQSGLKLVSERDIKLGDQFGREVVLTNDTEIVTNRMYLVKQRLFQTIATVQTSIAKDPQSQRDIEKFLDSFQFASVK